MGNRSVSQKVLGEPGEASGLLGPEPPQQRQAPTHRLTSPEHPAPSLPGGRPLTDCRWGQPLTVSSTQWTGKSPFHSAIVLRSLGSPSH